MLSAAWHRYIFLFGLIGLAAGMLFGTVPTSIPQIILAANWLLEGNFKWKWQQLKSNKIFWILASLFFLHVIGMTYTENIQRGLDDLRNKMPLLVLPLILFSTKPLSIKEFKLLFGFFFLSVFVSSVCCYLVYAGFTKKVIIDIRKASVFMSHIRFSLFIAFAIIGLLYYSIKEKQIWIKISCVIATFWLLFFMYKLEMATGFLSLVLVGGLLLVLFSLKWLPKKVSLALVILITTSAGFVLNSALSSLNMYDKIPSKQTNTLLEKTKNGRYYLQDTIFGLAENGNLITININDYWYDI
jgi:O-antigen ligase